MSQSKPFHESASSTQYINPNRKYMRPSYSGSGPRKGSVPEIPNFKMPIPANVINLIPKSSRESTLKIFKAKEKEDRELGHKGDEPIIKKGNFYLDSIRKNDGSLIVEFLVDKGKKDYEKKKNQKTVGSMYVNDLWGKQYEVKIKRQTRINSEIKKVESQKRRPLHLKLEEAVEYFEHKNVNSARTEEAPKIFVSSHRNNLRLFTDMGNYCDSETGPQSERIERPLYTEPKTNSDDSDEKDEKIQKVMLLPSIKGSQKSSISVFDKADTTMCTSGPATATNSRPSKDRLYSTHRSTKAWITTESSEPKMKGTQFDFDIFEEKSYAESNERSSKIPVKQKRSAKTKSCFEETKGAFDNLLVLCQEGISDKGIAHTLQGVKEVWAHEAIDKQKRQKIIKRKELLQECQDSMKRGKEKERHSQKLSM